MSRWAKWMKYCATESGRYSSLYCVLGASISSFLWEWAPNSILMGKYQEFVTCYKNGVERRLSDAVYTRFDKALDMIKEIDDLERSRYQMFCVFGLDPLHKGTKHSVYGTSIGIPANFDYETLNDVPTSEIVLKNQPVPWNSDDGKIFKESLIFTEKEQMFVMLREILYTRSFQTPINCFTPLIAFIGAYSTAHALNTKLNLFTRPFSLRLVMYSLVGLFWLGNYWLTTDSLQLHYDTEVDKDLVNFGEDIVEAGVGYYDKVLKRNVAFRNITGDLGIYSAAGNMNMLFRMKMMPMTVRKEFFEKHLEEIQQKKQDNFQAD